MNLQLAEKFSPKVLSEYLTLDSLYYVFFSYLLLYIAKKINDFFQSSFSLDEELLVKDNKALAVSFTGYFLGVGIIIHSVLTSPISIYWDTVLEGEMIKSTFDTFIWGIIGIFLLNLSRFINDKALLPHFKNREEIIRDHNVGTGVVQLGSYIASALIIASIISHGGERLFLLDFIFTLFYYFLAQFLLIFFSKVYARVLNYPLHKEIEADNEAAGIAYSLNLVAMGIFLAFPLTQTENILVFLMWFVNGVVFIILSRVLFDKIILSKSDLNHEIQNDRNWGVAFLEGCISILIAYIVNASFL